MAAFPDVIAAQLRGATVRCADLVRFDFLAGEKRYWPGFGPFTDRNHETWEGVGNVGTVSGVTSGPGQAMDELTFALFGDDTMMEKFQESVNETAGREAFLYQQFFDVRQFDESGNWVDWLPLDEPMVTFWGTMGPLIIDRPLQEPGGQGTRTRAVSIHVVNAFKNRRRPAYSYYSHRDQLARSSDGNDQIFVNASRMASVTVRWPKF